MSNKRVRVTPEGVPTEDPEEYLDAWASINDKLEELLGVQVFGFDPDVAIADCEWSSMTATLPLWLVKRIIQLQKPAVDSNGK